MTAIAWQVLASKTDFDRPLPTELFAIGNADEFVKALMFAPRAARADSVVEQLRISKLTADLHYPAEK